MPITLSLISSSGKTDSDGDYYPDEWEAANSHRKFHVGVNDRDESLVSTNFVMFKGEKVTPSYAYQEELARKAQREIDKTLYDNQDWSQGGKQW